MSSDRHHHPERRREHRDHAQAEQDEGKPELPDPHRLVASAA